MSAIFFGTLGIESAFATTYYCDNDASGYPCSNYQAGSLGYSWVYRSGQSSDFNGDDRLIKSANGSGQYHWGYNTTVNSNYISVDVYLDNYSFTNSRANYSYNYSSGGEIFFLGSINQNTAPGGWNRIKSNFPFGQRTNINIILHQNDGNKYTSTYTGADGARLITPTTLTSTLTEQPLISNLDPKVAVIQNKMLNAVDYYKNIRGSFDVKFTNNQQEQSVDFVVSEENSPGSYTKITGKNGMVIEQKSDGNSLLGLDYSAKSFEKSKVAKVEKVKGPRYFKDETGKPVYVHRHDPAQAHAAHEVTLPQNYAFWLSNSDSKVIGYEKLLNRNVSVIEGKHDTYLSKKLGANTFKMWVDTATGTLLKLEGKDTNGKVAYFIKVNDIKFDQGVDKSKFAMKEVAGWKDLSSNKSSIKNKKARYL